MERKQGSGTFKADGEAGSFEAVFATFNVIDKQGDVTLPGAFTEGAPVRIMGWGHDWGSLAVGKGDIHANEREAWVLGRFFLDTSGGKETYNVVKGLGELQEWSYGYNIVKSHPGQLSGQSVRYLDKLAVFEVSPVMLGAGVGTRTRVIKGESAAGRLTPGRVLAQIVAEELLQEGAPPGPRSVKRQIAQLTTPDMVRNQVQDMELELLELDARRIGAKLASGRTRLDVLRADLRSEGHSAEWVEGMLAAEVDAAAQRLLRQLPELGGDAQLATRLVYRQLMQAA